MANGIIIIDKPMDWTSQDVTAKLRGIFHERRIGHGGTLDPMATGVLPVFVGRATRAVEFMECADKEYVAELRLGLVTDTQDSTGNVLSRIPASVSREALEQALSAFRGEISQIPPMYSAIKIGGKKLYELARKGTEVERKPRPVTIHELEVLDGSEDTYQLRIVCSKGTYIRTLLHDIGASLGCGGCMAALRRTRVGTFSLSQATPLQTLIDASPLPDPQAALMPVDALFSAYAALIVTSLQAEKLKHGAAIFDRQFPADGTYRAYAETGEFLLLGKLQNRQLTTIKSFFEVNDL